MALNMDEVLNQIGWKNGFHIPLANKENQILLEEFQKLLDHKEKAKQNFNDAKVKLGAMQKHLKYLKVESEENQKMLTTYAQHTKGERHKYFILNTQYERTNKDIRKVKHDIEEINSRIIDKQNALKKVIEKIEKVKASSAWDGEALKAWNDSINKKLDDEELLKQFSKLDDRRLKELENRRQNLEKELTEKREIVEKMDTDIKNYHQMQDKTDKLLEEQEGEKKHLTQRWLNAIKILRKRDNDISKIKDNIRKTQSCIQENQELLNEENSFLHTHQTCNKAVQEEIVQLNVINSRTRKELNNIIQYVLDLTNNVNTSRGIVLTISNKLQTARNESKSIKEKMELTNKKNQKAMHKLKELEVKLQQLRSVSMTSTEKARDMQEMFNFEKTLAETMAQDNERNQKNLYKNRIELNKHIDAGKNLQQQISIATNTIKNVHSKIMTQLETINLQREMLYHLAYNQHELEVKVSHLDGTGVKWEDTFAMDMKISELEKSVIEQVELRNFLQGQITRTQDDMRRLTLDIAADGKKINKLKSKLQDQMLMFNGGVKQTAVAKLKSQQKQVEENLLRLRVSQLAKAIASEENSIYDLRQFRLLLETSLKEREIDIRTHQQILEAQKRNMEESKGRLRADINHKKIRIEQFQKKHHIALMALGSNENGEPLSMTQFKMKDAVERSSLKNEHEELERKMKKTEKEIIAMENTLDVVNKTNEVFERTLMPVTDEVLDRIQSEITRIQEEICDCLDSLRKQRKIFSEKQKRMNDLQDRLVETQQKWEVESKNFEELEESYLTLKQEDVVREEKLARTLKNVKTYKKRVHKKSLLVKPEKNLEIKQLQDANKTALQQLKIIASDHEEATSKILDSLQEKSLVLPSGSKSTTSTHSMISLSSTRSNYLNLSCTAVTCVTLSFCDETKDID